MYYKDMGESNVEIMEEKYEEFSVLPSNLIALNSKGVHKQFPLMSHINPPKPHLLTTS